METDQPEKEPSHKSDKMFTLKKWNLVAMWSWDVECDTCAICRVQVMDACLQCQSENKQDDCVVVWGECNHSFHNCCMSLWVKQSNRCPLCQQEWVVQRTGKWQGSCLECWWEWSVCLEVENAWWWQDFRYANEMEIVLRFLIYICLNCVKDIKKERIFDKCPAALQVFVNFFYFSQDL